MEVGVVLEGECEMPSSSLSSSPSPSLFLKRRVSQEEEDCANGGPPSSNPIILILPIFLVGWVGENEEDLSLLRFHMLSLFKRNL